VVYREPVLDMQLIQERIAGAAMELFASTCALSRWDAEIELGQRNGGSAKQDSSAAELFLRKSFRRVRGFLAGLTDNDDEFLLKAANSALGKV